MMTSLIQLLAISLIAITVIVMGVLPMYALYLVRDDTEHDAE